MPLFKTTGDAINFAGHKIPVSALLVGATVLGALVLLRSRSGAPAAAGLPQGIATQNDIASLASSQTQEIAALESQVNQLGQTIANPPKPTPAPSPPASGWPGLLPPTRIEPCILSSDGSVGYGCGRHPVPAQPVSAVLLRAG